MLRSFDLYAALALSVLVASECHCAEPFTVAPPVRQGGSQVEPTVGVLAIPKTVLRYPPSSGNDFRGDAFSINPPEKITVAVVPKKVFDDLPLDRIVCIAMSDMLEVSSTCDKPVTNEKRRVRFHVTRKDANNKICEIELFGSSEALALGDANWVERHRFFIELAYDGRETLSLLVSDYEPMFRTTPELEPVGEKILEYIPRSNDANLRVLQQKVQDRILSTIKRIIS